MESEWQKTASRTIKQEQRFLRDVAKVQARIQNGQLKKEVKIGEAIGRLKERYPRVARYHALTFDAKTRQLENQPLEERRKVAASLDGSYLLRTDRQDLSADEAWRIYLCAHTLLRMLFPVHEESLVRTMPTSFISSSVESNRTFFLCVLAYHLLVAHRDDVASARYPAHHVGDGAGCAGDSPGRHDCDTDRPRRSPCESDEAALLEPNAVRVLYEAAWHTD